MSELKVGDAAPDFETVDQNGEPVSLKALRGKRVVIYFYPKDNTTGCTAQACAFRDSYPQIEGANAVVLGVSPDSAKSHQGFRTKYELPFPLLIDQDHKIAEAFDVWREKSMYGRKYMGILRSHFVIDEQGKIADAQYNVKSTESAAKAVAALA
jgi:peroxiredoxin Q/BCP